MEKTCVVCSSSQLNKMFELKAVPICATPYLESKAPKAKGDLDIVCCKGCGHIFNASFDGNLAAEIYADEFAGSIPTSAETLRRLEWILTDALLFSERLYRTVVEIGSSNFVFSKLMLNSGSERVLAFEPSKAFCDTGSAAITFINDFFSADAIPDKFSNFDLVVLRHVLEHIPSPRTFVREIAEKMLVGSRIYIEVPNAQDILEHGRIYDFFYEHVNYFSPPGLEALLAEFSLKVEKCSYLVGGQHFGILAEKTSEAVFCRRPPHTLDSARASLFLASRSNELRCFLETVIEKHARVGIYGAGAHAISALSICKEVAKKAAAVFDISPYKIGKIMPGTNLEICKPTESSIRDLDAILVIASLHQPEILHQLRNDHSYRGELYGTHPNLEHIDTI